MINGIKLSELIIEGGISLIVNPIVAYIKGKILLPNKKKELCLLEKELELRERELVLKENELKLKLEAFDIKKKNMIRRELTRGIDDHYIRKIVEDFSTRTN